MPAIKVWEFRYEIIVLIIFSSILGYLLTSVFQDSAPSDSVIASQSNLLSLSNPQLESFVADHKSWEVSGQEALIIDKSGQIRLKQVKALIYYPKDSEQSSEVQTKIQADYGLVNQNEQRLELWGNVMIFQEELQIESQRVHYFYSQKVVELPATFRFTRGQEVLLGQFAKYSIEQSLLESQNLEFRK